MRVSDSNCSRLTDAITMPIFEAEKSSKIVRRPTKRWRVTGKGYGQVSRGASCGEKRCWQSAHAFHSLAEALALPLPTLPPLPTSFVITSIGATSTNGSANDDAKGADGIWSDEEEKRFYTDLLDLQGEVPPYLLSSSGKETDHKVLRESEEDLDADAFGGDIAHDGVSDDAALNANAEKDNEDGGLAPAPAAQLTALFGRLPDMSSLAAVDKAAIDFAMLNSKAARRRLVKVLRNVSD